MSTIRVGKVLRTGAIAAIAVAYLSMVGLIEQFADIYAIGTSVTFARVFFVLPPLVAGWVVTRPLVERGVRQELTVLPAALNGGFTGLVTGGLVGATMLAVDGFGVDRVRNVFVAVSDTLLETLSLDHSTGTGAAIWLVAGTAAGATGGLLRAIPSRARRVVLAGPLTILVLGLLQRVVRTSILELDRSPDWLYDTTTQGLTWGGGLGVAAVVLAVVVGRERRRRQPTPVPTSPVAGSAYRTGQLVKAVAAFAVVLVLPWIVGSAISGTLGTVLIFVMLGLGLNIVVGYAGLLDLGYVAFFAFGAYTTALLTGASVNTTDGAADPSLHLSLNFYVAIPFVVLLAAGLGLLIGAPVLRLRGDYLAIVTLGLGEVAYTIATSKWAEPLIGGPQGMRDVTGASLFGADFQNDPQHFYYLALAFAALALFVSWRVRDSRIGRAWNAMREDEQVADAMGISTTRYKLLAFATGGGIGSLGGALLAVQIGSLTPASFDLNVSILALAIIILGGLGSLKGVVVGAVALVGLPGFLREFEEFRPLALGFTIIAIMLLRPQGVLPATRKSTAIAEEDRDQDAWARAGVAGGQPPDVLVDEGGAPA